MMVVILLLWGVMLLLLVRIDILMCVVLLGLVVISGVRVCFMNSHCIFLVEAVVA
jgi:hypothetical protein